MSEVFPARLVTAEAFGWVPDVRAAALIAGIALAALAQTASAAVSPVPEPEPSRQVLVPGAVYEQRSLQGGQRLHVIRASPSARIRLGPITTGPSVLSRGSLRSAVRTRLNEGVVAGVNGDYFNLSTGYPSGVLLADQRLESDPEPARAALIVPPPSGRIDVTRLAMASTWQATTEPGARPATVRTIQAVNRPRARSTETILFTPSAGPTTPDGSSLFEVRVRLDDPAPVLVGQAREGTVVARRANGGTDIGAGHIVLSGVGSAGSRIASALPLGQRLTVTMGLIGLPEGATQAIGGGPALVQDGRVVTDPDESFTSSQLDGRTSRTAVGQRPDGAMLLVAADGPVQGSPGLTSAELATTMADLGASEAIGMDSGGSAQMVRYTTEVVPWESPRPISTALTLAYSGVQLQPLPRRLTPNSDGVLERVSAIVRSPTPGVATVSARRRGGGARRIAQVEVGPGARRVDLSPRRLRMRDGVWDVRVRLVPSDGQRPTAQTRRVIVDRTLGGLTATRVVRSIGGTRQPVVRIGFRLAASARVTVRVRTARGTETLVSGRRLGAGRRAVLWDRRIDGEEVGGTATIEVLARGRLGTAGLSRPVTLPPVGATPRG